MEYLMTYGWAILVVMIVGVVLWQLGVFTVGTEQVVTTGWAKLKPLSASIAYKSNGSYETTLTNTVGTSIKVTYINMTEALAGAECNTVALNGVTYTNGVGNSSVKPGDGFEITSTDCPGKNEGDPFDLMITIDYTAVMGGISTSHRETGHVKGPCEA
ncbi:MAG: hypothetical protein JW724_00290 [Candidatus Altiarchaeota archaeon]|nr:hypothetical protein [Candidatus Altiarchaeota archaeon]